MEFLVRGATEHDEPGVFMAFEETGEELAANVASLDFDLKALIAGKKPEASLGPFASSPALETLTRSVVAPQRSRTNTSRNWLRSSGTRFDASE